MYSTEIKEKHRYYLSFLGGITGLSLLGLQKILSLTDDYTSESFLNNLRIVVTRIDSSPSFYLQEEHITFGDITLTQVEDREYKIDLSPSADVLESLFKIQSLSASRICFKLEGILYFKVCVYVEEWIPPLVSY